MYKKDLNRTFETFSAHKSIRVGELTLDKTSIVEYSVSIDLTGDVIIEKYAHIAHKVMIFTHKHRWGHTRKLRKNIEGSIIPVDLHIGMDAFIGFGSILIAVSFVGSGAIIGAGTVLTSNVPPYEIWAGNPARKIGDRRDDLFS